MRCDCLRLRVDDAQLGQPALALRDDDVIGEESEAADLDRRVVLDEGFQFFSDGSSIGAVTTLKFFAPLLVVM